MSDNVMWQMTYGVKSVITFTAACVLFLLGSDGLFAQDWKSAGRAREFTPRITFERGVALPMQSDLHLLLRSEIGGMSAVGDAPMTLTSDTSTHDSASAAPKRKLLPDNMSWMERSLWGEAGMIRGIGIASPLTPEVRKSELGLRRTMLSIHQIGGFVTVGLMAATCYYGQRYLNTYPNVTEGNAHSLYNTHQSLVTATIISYSATGLLSILSPPPLIRRDEYSTITLHKTLAWVHFAGMVLTPIIAKMIGRNIEDYKMAQFHQISAYITLTALTASMVVMTF